MKNLLIKEFRLASSPLSYIFVAAALMTLLPGYPILMGAFFICMGIFHSFQNAREANDVLYTVLLPIEKRGYVKAKFAFTCLIQLAGFLVCALLTVLRMTVLSDAAAYVNNALMNATPVFLAFVLLVYTAFNTIFICGYFKTSYKIGFPFLFFGIAALLIILIAESLQYIPGMGFLHVPSGERIGLQLCILLCACFLYAGATSFAYLISKSRFEKIDL